MTNCASILVCIFFDDVYAANTGLSSIDVVEPNADPTGQSVGNKLIVDSQHQYSDLDELIVNHVQAMARKVEELMMHEKFKAGPEEELRASIFCSRGPLNRTSSHMI